MTTENLHEDSLEEHLFTEPKDLQNWMERVGEILAEQEPGEDIKATLVAALKADTKEQLRQLKSVVHNGMPRGLYLHRSFLAFATDTLDDILFDQDFEALATRLLKAHAEA